jgi:hypothetical protein
MWKGHILIQVSPTQIKEKNISQHQIKAHQNIGNTESEWKRELNIFSV